MKILEIRQARTRFVALFYEYQGQEGEVCRMASELEDKTIRTIEFPHE
jgi:hypothetical protein